MVVLVSGLEALSLLLLLNTAILALVHVTGEGVVVGVSERGEAVFIVVVVVVVVNEVVEVVVGVVVVVVVCVVGDVVVGVVGVVVIGVVGVVVVEVVVGVVVVFKVVGVVVSGAASLPWCFSQCTRATACLCLFVRGISFFFFSWVS